MTPPNSEVPGRTPGFSGGVRPPAPQMPSTPQGPGMGQGGGGGVDPAMLDVLLGGGPGGIGAGQSRDLRGPVEGPGFAQKNAPTTPPVKPPGSPQPTSPGGGQQEFPEWEPGMSVAGDDREGRMAMMTHIADQNAQQDRKNRTHWSDADWDNVIRKSLEPQTRQDQQGRWEYLIHGQWVDQATFDDPMFRQNIYDPWRADVEAYWRGEREKSEKYKAGQREGAAARERDLARRRAGRMGGRMGSSTNRGG